MASHSTAAWYGIATAVKVSQTATASFLHIQGCYTPDQELTCTVQTLLSGVAAHFAATVSMQAPVVKQRQPQVNTDTLWFG